MPAIPFLGHNKKFSFGTMIRNLPFVSAVNVDLFARGCPEYNKVEAFINKSFKKKYSTEAKFVPSILISLNYNKRIFEVLGMGLAESGPLFLEQYLQYPIEQEIGFFYKTAIKRESIAEMGTVISFCRSTKQLLLILLINYLYKTNREWLVLLSNSEIENTLKRMHFTTVPFSDESIKKKEQWAGYLNDESRIMYGHIPSAMSILMQKPLTRFSLSLFSKQLNELAEQWKHKDDE